MTTCYLGIGSNLGRRRKNIATAIERINRIKETRVVKASSLIETEPAGGPPQGKFLNATLEIETNLTPRELLQELQAIESQLGRRRGVKNAPRTIDLDILLYGELKLNEPELVIPHPRIKGRDFVLTPLREIAPQAVERLLNEDRQED